MYCWAKNEGEMDVPTKILGKSELFSVDLKSNNLKEVVELFFLFLQDLWLEKSVTTEGKPH